MFIRYYIHLQVVISTHHALLQNSPFDQMSIGTLQPWGLVMTFVCLYDLVRLRRYVGFVGKYKASTACVILVLKTLAYDRTARKILHRFCTMRSLDTM